MGLLTKTVKIQPKGSQIKYYKNLGYQFKKNEEIEVKVEDLTKGSHVLVECQCDYCNKIIEMEYHTYINRMNGIIKKIACLTCKSLKIEESNLQKYNVKTVLSLDIVKQKIKATNLERYGVENPMQNTVIKQKAENTNIKKYGYYNCMMNEDVRQKAINTCREHFGVDNPFLSSIVQEKIHTKIIQKYNVDNINQSELIKEKRKSTCLKKYGVENPSQYEPFKEKKVQTFLVKFGADNPMKNTNIQEKTKQTNLQIYGFPCVLQNPEIKAKINQTCLEKYGTANPMQSTEVKEKALHTMFNNGTCPSSLQQNAYYDVIKLKYPSAELNKPIGQFSGDIVLDNINIEIDYGGHNLCVVLGDVTQEEFDQKQLIRDKIIKSKGYKIIRIISYNFRKIPSDEIILDILDQSKQYFQDYSNHSWREWNIDQGVYRDAEHKDGKPYDYGPLRTIKKSDVELVS